MEKKVAIISHRRDFDGIASAAELLRMFGPNVEMLVFTNPNKQDILSALAKLSSISNADIYITDVSVPNKDSGEIIYALKDLASRGNSIKWLDHHPWPDDAEAAIRKIADTLICGENKDYCATELVYANLCNNDPVCKRLAYLAHLTDFNIRPEDKELDSRLIKISQCIAFLDEDTDEANKLRSELVAEVSKGAIDGGAVNLIYYKYKADEEKNIKMIERTLDSTYAGKYKIAIAFAENLQSNMACSIIKEKTGATIQVFITTKDWTAHVRSDPDVNSSLLSTKMGGNGHPQASGFQLKVDGINEKERMFKYKSAVFEAAKSVFGS